LSRCKSSLADIWLGAAVTALLFTIGKFLIGLYLNASPEQFGAADRWW
jgi:membrane protein